MKTMTFIKRISNIFKPQHQNIETMKYDNNTPNNTRPAQQQYGTTETSSASEIPLTPVVNVSPAIKPVSMAAYETQRIKSNDLGSWAMDQCISLNGNMQGLISSLEIVIKNYKLEAQTKEEEMKGELTNAINRINDEVIKLNNQIAIIREYFIPEKEKQIALLEKQMSLLESNINYDLQTDLGSETYTILAVSKARITETVRNLQAKIIELKTQIEQKEIRINTMKDQIANINLFNIDIVLRRMHIFFNGWLKGLEGLEAEPVFINNTKLLFENYSNKLINKTR